MANNFRFLFFLFVFFFGTRIVRSVQHVSAIYGQFKINSQCTNNRPFESMNNFSDKNNFFDILFFLVFFVVNFNLYEVNLWKIGPVAFTQINHFEILRVFQFSLFFYNLAIFTLWIITRWTEGTVIVTANTSSKHIIIL